MTGYLARATGIDAPPNPFAPSIHAWGADFAVCALSGGLAETMDATALRHLVDLVEARERQPSLERA